MALLFPEDVLEELLRLYGEEELATARATVGSRTLREAMFLLMDARAGVADIVVPHYWAVYYHDGRAGFAAPSGRFLVFYPDPDDDPRLEGGRPVRFSDARHLSREEFLEGLDRNEERASSGLPPFMLVVRSVGPAGAHPFFDRLTAGAAARMDQLAGAALDAHVQAVVDDEGGERRAARLRL